MGGGLFHTVQVVYILGQRVLFFTRRGARGRCCAPSVACLLPRVSLAYCVCVVSVVSWRGVAVMEDEDGVDISAHVRRTAGVHYGEIAIGEGSNTPGEGPSGDGGVSEGMRKGHIHVAGGEEGDRFDLSSGSAATRERQEALLREFETRRRARALAVTTDDKEVRRQLRGLGEPMTLFGEREMERRDRLRKHLAELDAMDGGVLPVPEEAEVVETVDVQRELFYTEGTAALMRARTAIASYSLPRAADRLARAKKRRTDTHVDEVAELDAAAAATVGLANECSQVGDERPLSTCRFSPNDGGGLVLTTSWSGGAKLWRADDDACAKVLTIKAHEDRITGSDFHPSASAAMVDAAASESVAFGTACADGVAHLWSIGGKHLRTLKGHADRLGRMVFHPCGDFVATAGFDRTWRLWSVETGEELLCQEGHSRPVYDLSFHPDGSLAASVGLEAHGRVWDLRVGKCITTLVGHNKQCLSVDFSPNGYQLVTGSDDHTAKVWDLRKKGCVYTIPAHSKLISAVRYEPLAGGYFVTASYDAAVKVWSARDFSCINTLRGHDAKVMCADVAPGGQTCASVSYDRTLKLWKQQGQGGGVKTETEVVVKMEEDVRGVEV